MLVEIRMQTSGGGVLSSEQCDAAINGPSHVIYRRDNATADKPRPTQAGSTMNSSSGA